MTVVLSKAQMLELYPRAEAAAPRLEQHTTDANRQKRRALIKAIGARQFKKLYRKAQV